MYGIIDPRIIWRNGRFAEDIPRGEFTEYLDVALTMDIRINVWSGEDRKGRPMVIIWSAGQRAGLLYRFFEITGRE